MRAAGWRPVVAIRFTQSPAVLLDGRAHYLILDDFTPSPVHFSLKTSLCVVSVLVISLKPVLFSRLLIQDITLKLDIYLGI